MNISQLQKLIERYFSAGPAAIGDSSAMDVFLEFRGALERGEVRFPRRPIPKRRPDGA